MVIEKVSQALQAVGLRMRGCFRPRAEDGVPEMPDGAVARTVVLAGNAGPAMWERFTAVRADHGHSLDAWSEAVLVGVAERAGGHAVFPFHRPYLPFQRWAVRAESCHPSPLGILIHPQHGLWHGLRGALLFAADFAPAAVEKTESPCATCAGRPCLAACPVGAFSGVGYDVPRCVAWLDSAAGEDCMASGCRARRACPVGSEFCYAPAQARFHMEAFRQACR